MSDEMIVSSNYNEMKSAMTSILDACENSGILVRALGSIAYNIHCPKYAHLQNSLNRPYNDIDLASYGKYSKSIRETLTSLGYEENYELFVLTESKRATFRQKKSNIQVEVFYEKLDFCHEISWNDRLHVDSPTIPLAELLLEKLQIVNISEYDLVNLIMLILEHPLGETNNETINIKLIAQLCAQEWGLWRTVTMNLKKVKQYGQQYSQLSPEDKIKLELQINELMLRLYSEPKSFAWKVRDQMGDRVKWYKDVEDN